VGRFRPRYSCYHLIPGDRPLPDHSGAARTRSCWLWQSWLRPPGPPRTCLWSRAGRC